MKKEVLNTGNQLVNGSTEYSEIEFPVKQGENLGLGTIRFKPESLAIENKDVVKGVIYLIESSGTEYSDIAVWAFRESCNRKKVNCKELIDAYWEAYSDPYVGKEGIQWRHLWKHIEKQRHGSGDRYYSYDEMLHICHKEFITTEHFEFIEKDKWKRK